MYELSPTLDHGELDDFRQAALDLDMYVEMGVGKINPYMTAELPAVRALGNGDYVAGMVRMIETAAAMGWTTLWTACGGVKDFPSPTTPTGTAPEAPWSHQLRATTHLVSTLLPVLRAHRRARWRSRRTRRSPPSSSSASSRNWRTRPSAICLDPGNLPARGELPDEGIRRVAPHVVSTQLRDVVLFPAENGVVRYLSPVGDGLVDWTRTLAVLLRHRPDLNLTIEAMGGLAGPDGRAVRRSALAVRAARLHRRPTAQGCEHLADQHLRRVRAGDAEPADELDRIDPDHRAAHDRFVARSARHLREVLASPQFRAATTMPKEDVT